jgi:FkbM family methyltransferase
MSLPALLGTVEAATTAGPPYLRPDDVLSAKWRERLTGAVGSAVKPHAQYKVGIAWSGNPQHADDRRRSIPLEMFAPLAAVPGVRLVNLQKGPGSEQVALSGGRVPMLHPPGDFDAAGAFTDTAAIIGQLDLVIAADTAVAHLAGALHVPTWLALSHLPDWRWRNSGETTPWYPAMRLWRQSRPGQWEDVFDRMTAALAQRARKQEAGAKGGRTNDEGQTIAAWRRSRRLATNGNAALKQTRHGPMLYNRHDAYIGRSLDEYGEFSPGEVDVFRQVLKPGDVVIEAGANIGAHTVPLAQFVGRSGAVHAFEPQRAIFQMLCANLALSALPNVFARQAAVGAQAGSIVVPQFDYDRPNNFGGLALGGLSQGAAPPGGETVPVLTIDSLELSSLALIKIDVEGMEADVLEGARATIARHKPILYVENDREEKSAALIALIASLGYRLYWHAPPMFAERNLYQNPVNTFGNTVSRNMLCLHASLPAQIRGLAEVGSRGVGE